MPPNPVTQGISEARAVRRELGVDPFQPLDPTAVARRLGILLVRRPLRSAVLSGMHAYDQSLDSHFILVNSTQRIIRQRFTTAHEIGHARFDRDTIVESLPASDVSPQEKRANAFAGELLMPEAAVKKWNPVLPWGEDVNDIARLAVHFGLSFEATIWRLYNAQRIEDPAVMKARRDEIAADLRRTLREPGDGATEYPEQYIELIKEGVSRSLVSRGRAAELLASGDEY